MRARTRWLGLAGLLVLVVALLWLPVAAPRLQKLPGGINDTMHYSGSFVTMVNPQTGAQLTTPMTVPMTIDRQVQSIKTGAHKAQLKETLTLTIGTQVQHQVNLMTLDRRSMKLADKTLPTYYINLPFNTSSTDTYFVWKPETDTAYPLVKSEGAATTKVDGLSLNRFTGTMAATPVTAAERTSLASQGMPMSLSSQQVADRLTAAGIDMPKLGAAMQTALTPVERGKVLTALTSPLPLVYEWSSNGNALIEHRTGAVVGITDVTETVAVAPDFAAAAPVVDLLKPHANVPEIGKLLTTLGIMQATPAQTVYSLKYTQTPASISERVSAAKDAVRQLSILRTWIPGGLALLGVLLLIGAAFTARRRVPPEAMPIRRPIEEEPAIRRAA